MPLSDWQASFRGLAFGAGTSIHLAMPIEGLGDLPDLRTSDLALLRRDGLHPGDDFLSGRSFPLELRALTTTAGLQAVLDQMQAAFMIGAEAPFVFRLPGVAGGGERQVNVRCRRRSARIENERHVGRARMVVQLDATDPRIYSSTPNVLPVGLPIAAGGRTYPLLFNRTYGGLPSGGTANITNAGTYSTPMLLRFDGYLVNPRLENLGTGQVLELTTTVNPGDYVLLDTAARTVLLNGTASRYSSLTSSGWFDLAPGLNQLTFRALAGTGTASITWRDAWA